MNLENFADYLKYPSRLYQLPYEELKSLSLQYPYCANFHVLLLIKSKLEGHPELEKNLAKAATYSVDRSFLRQLLQEEALIEVESQLTIGEDEVLELKDLFSLENDPIKVPIELEDKSEIKAPANAIPLQPSPDKDQDDDLLLPLEGAFAGQTDTSDTSLETPTASFSEVHPIRKASNDMPEEVVDDAEMGIPTAAEVKGFTASNAIIGDLGTVLAITQDWEPPQTDLTPTPEPEQDFVPADSIIADSIAGTQVVEAWWERQESMQVIEWELPKQKEKILITEESIPHVKVAPKTVGAPLSKSNFKSFQKKYRRSSTRVAAVPSTPTPSAAEKVQAKKVAEESLKENLGIASETLAGLLVQQEQYDRAIKMYEHLSLLIPEKNTYFAAKIDAIKNL